MIAFIQKEGTALPQFFLQKKNKKRTLLTVYQPE